MDNRKSQSLGLLAQIHKVIIKRKEIDVRWKCTKQVQDVVTTVVSDYSFTLHRGAQKNLFLFVVDHSMWEDLQLAASLLQQVQVFRMGHDRFAKIDGAIHNRLFLFPLKDAGNDGLGSDAVAAVVNHDRAKGVEAFEVNGVVHLDALQVVPRCDKCGS